MNMQDIKQHIKSSNFDRIYIFDVDEGYVAKQYIDMIVKKSGCRKEYADSVADIYTKLKTRSLLNSPTVYIIIDDKEFTNSKYESRWDNIFSAIKDDILILEYTSSDSRIKFWKKFKDRAIKFEKLPDRILTKYIKREADLNDKNCTLLIDICEGDCGRILLEVDKIKNFSDITGLKADKAFQTLLKEGAIYQPPKDVIFDFVEAVLSRKTNRSYELLQECYELGEPNMKLISVLYTNFRNLLQVQTCTSDNISKSTGLNGWEIKNVKKHVDRYSDEEICSILKLLHEVEKGIKTGEIADEYAMNYVLANILW